ncbi:MAG: hypothetical protein QOJ59_1243, partial [Thermomicrobiales bacterium]|nr:hypothetical protein [Thermomicrobiales bacterium]
WGPRVVPHRLLRRQTACTPCYLFDCPIGQACLDVTPEEIAAAVVGLLPTAIGSPAAIPTMERGAA